jgi:hypothetical protein
VFPTSGLQPRDRRLSRADALGELSLSDAGGRPSFQELVKKGKLFLQPLIFSLHSCTFECTTLKFFVREHL